MFKIALEGLLARKLRLVTTALAVILGVAFTAGTLVLTDTMSNIFNDLSAGVYKGTDAVVRAKAVFDGPMNMGEQRPLIDRPVTTSRPLRIKHGCAIHAWLWQPAHSSG